MIGIISLLIDVIVYILLSDVFLISKSLSKIISFILASINSFLGNKIFNIQNKFLNKFEKSNIGNDPTVDILTMIWTSKESIYKAVGLKGISFLKNIKIDKVIEKDKLGIGYYINGIEKIKFNLNFFYVNDYIICYASKI